MSDENNNREILDDGAINNLPENEKKETQEIINDIKKDEEGDKPNSDNDVDKKPKEDEKPKPDEGDGKKPDEGKPDGDKPNDEGDKNEPPRNKTKLIPTWIHEKSVRENKETIEGLEKTIEGLKTSQEDKPDSEISDTDKQALKAEIETIAKDKNLEPDLIESIVDLAMKHGGKIPAELQDRLKIIDKIQEDSEIKAEEIAFNSNFDKYVIPLIKEEYGDGVSEDTIKAIREKAKENAYTDEYKQTPYSVIYKGIDDFRKFKRPKGGSDEGGKGGFERAGDGSGGSEQIDFKNVTEADIDKMDGETFDKYSEWQETNERKNS